MSPAAATFAARTHGVACIQPPGTIREHIGRAQDLRVVGILGSNLEIHCKAVLALPQIVVAQHAVERVCVVLAL